MSHPSKDSSIQKKENLWLENMLMKVTNWVAAEFHAKAYTKQMDIVLCSGGPETIFQLTEHTTTQQTKKRYKKITVFISFLFKHKNIHTIHKKEILSNWWDLQNEW